MRLNYRKLHCLFNSVFGIKKRKVKSRNAESGAMLWRHHGIMLCVMICLIPNNHHNFVLLFLWVLTQYDIGVFMYVLLCALHICVARCFTAYLIHMHIFRNTWNTQLALHEDALATADTGITRHRADEKVGNAFFKTFMAIYDTASHLRTRWRHLT